MTLLDVRGLTAGYGGAAVIWDVDLTVEQGEIVTLLGPNGAGKTTTLLAIMSIVNPLAGTVGIAGVPTAVRRTYLLSRHGVALVPDDRGLLASLTVRENLALVGAPRRDALELFPELVPLMNRRARLLSGGEQQMLALARAFASEPRLLLVDEMSQGLAPIVAKRLLMMLRRAATEWNAGVLVVEQDVSAALMAADRGYVMHHGRIVIADQPAEVLLNQRDVLETAYLGIGDVHRPGQSGLSS
jgi:branched-chain amino acid transport system ATP-binding protein